jgi:hypothetical protein
MRILSVQKLCDRHSLTRLPQTLDWETDVTFPDQRLHGPANISTTKENIKPAPAKASLDIPQVARQFAFHLFVSPLLSGSLFLSKPDVTKCA